MVHALPVRANAARRASDKGFLSMGLDDYLRILDWTGRQVRRDKRGAIRNELAPVLERLGMSAEFWLDTATNFGRWFLRAAGRVSLLPFDVGYLRPRLLFVHIGFGIPGSSHV